MQYAAHLHRKCVRVYTSGNRLLFFIVFIFVHLLFSCASCMPGNLFHLFWSNNSLRHPDFHPQFVGGGKRDHSALGPLSGVIMPQDRHDNGFSWATAALCVTILHSAS